MTTTARLTVASYNLYLGADLSLLFGVRSLEELASRAAVVRDQLERTSFDERAGVLARLLAREQVDVAGLQEVSRWTSSPVDGAASAGEEAVLADFLPALLAELEAAGTPYDAHAVVPSFAGALPVDGRWMSVSGANAVLVRRGGALTLTSEATGRYSDRLELTTGIEGVTFPVERGWGWVDGTVAGRPVRFVNTHTEAWDARTRDAQRDELLGLLAAASGAVVVVGDFNAVPREVGMPAEYADAWLAAGGDPSGGHTSGQAPDLANEASALWHRIDYVFARDCEVLGCSVVGDRDEDRTPGGRLWPSDHAGVVARLGF